MEPLLTPEQAADILGIRVKTVHEFVRDGKLACVQVSARNRKFTEEQIQAFIRSRTIEPPKSIDNSDADRLPFRPKPFKGGEGLPGVSVRAQLLEEMRSW
jgi:excisionase family DNA binding protein